MQALDRQTKGDSWSQNSPCWEGTCTALGRNTGVTTPFPHTHDSWHFMEKQVSHYGLGWSSTEPHIFPLMFARAAPDCKTASNAFTAQTPLRPGLTCKTGLILAQGEKEKGWRRDKVARGCCHPKKIHIAAILSRRHVYQGQTPIIISYTSQVYAVKEIKTFTREGAVKII